MEPVDSPWRWLKPKHLHNSELKQHWYWGNGLGEQSNRLGSPAWHTQPGYSVHWLRGHRLWWCIKVSNVSNHDNLCSVLLFTTVRVRTLFISSDPENNFYFMAPNQRSEIEGRSDMILSSVPPPTTTKLICLSRLHRLFALPSGSISDPCHILRGHQRWLHVVMAMDQSETGVVLKLRCDVTKLVCVYVCMYEQEYFVMKLGWDVTEQVCVRVLCHEAEMQRH